MNSTSGFVQNILDLSRSEEVELKNGTRRLVLYPYDVVYLQNIIEKGAAPSRISFILTPNDVENIRNLLCNVISFKVKSKNHSMKGGINFKYFSNLQNLELIKIQPCQLIDMDLLRPQLKTLKCSQSLSWLKDILRHSEQTFENSFWINLKHLDISFNYLEYFDDSLSLLSTLEVFNASHNKIKSSEGLKLLKDVNYLNLSYNKLVDFPIFSAQTCTSLKILVLRYNFLGTLKGIQYLVHLSELDLGYNLLESHFVLAPLNDLHNLIMLDLNGNPLAFCKNHRILTASHLNSLARIKVVLDGKSLTAREIKESVVIGLKLNRVPMTSYPPYQTLDDTPASTSFNPQMIGSLNYNDDISFISTCSEDPSLLDEPIAKAYIRKKKKSVLNGSKNKDVQHLETNAALDKSESHIETKKRVQETRNELGDGWLLSANNILGSSSGAHFNESLKSQVSETESNWLKHKSNGIELGTNNASLEHENEMPSSATESVSAIIHNQENKDRINSSFEPKPTIQSDKVFVENSDNSSSFSESDEETEMESNLFIVQCSVEGKETEFILSVGSEIIAEKDVLTGKHLYSWNLKTLISAQEIQEAERIFVQLEFDVIRKDKQERTYMVDDLETARNLLLLLENHVEKRNLKLLSEGLTQCLKCDFKFQSSIAERVVIRRNESEINEENACPKCKSTLLIIHDSHPEPIAASNGNQTVELEPSSMSSGSRIDSFLQSMNSAKSLEDSGSFGKSTSSRPRSISSELQAQRKAISLSPSRLEENKSRTSNSASSSSVDCISLKSDENVPMNSTKLVYDQESARRSESDITVLSNPSQSSIAVISTTSSCEHINPIGGLEVIPEQEIFPNPYCSPGIYDSFSTSDTFYSTHTNVSSPAPKHKETAKKECGQVFNSSEEVSWYDSASADTYIQLSQDSTKTSKNVDDGDSRKQTGCTIEESVEIEDQSKEIWEELEEPCSLSLNEFIQIDHRIRLHLEVEVMNDGEELLATIKGLLFTKSPSISFKGYIVFSTMNVYLFQAITPGNSVKLTNLKNYSIKTLISIGTLLGSQGIIFNHVDSSYVLSLGDADKCNSFVTYLQDILVSKLKLSQVVLKQSAEKDLLNVKNQVLMGDVIDSLISDSGSSVSVEIFLFVTLIDKGRDSEQVALVLTESSINLAEIQYFVQPENSGINFVLKERQPISSLMAMHISKDLKTVSFHFLDEDENKKRYWILETNSKNSLASLLTTLRRFWEDIFLIEMQLSMLPKCLSCGFEDRG